MRSNRSGTPGDLQMKIFSNPAVVHTSMCDVTNELARSSIAWGKLLLQMTIVIGAAVVGSRFAARQPRDGAGLYSS